MNELLDRIAAALEKQTELLAKSVELQEEGCLRSREMHALNYEHAMLSIERHHFLRMRELLGLFVLSGETRADLLPQLFTAFNKWKQAMEDIDPTANIDFRLVERIFQHDLQGVHNALLKRIEEGTAESLTKDIRAALEVINNFLKTEQKEEKIPVREMTANFIEDLKMDEPPRTFATSVDFGIPETLNPQYGALQWGLRHEMFTAQELDEACCSGPKLTELVSRGENPYKCEFHTTWDDMPPEEDEDEV